MRVLFVYPNLYTQMGFNHGLASLSAVLREAGHETRLVNLNENLPPVPDREEIWALVREWEPGLIGFSCLTQQYDAALDLARWLRERATTEAVELPPLVVGGVHPTMVPEEVMTGGVWDHVGVGECEASLLELVGRLERDQPCDDVPNFLSWRGDERGEWVRNPVAEFPDLATLPEPDYGLFDIQRITDDKGGWFGLMSSRGCPYLCTYCLNHRILERYRADLGRSAGDSGFLRYRPAELLVAEIRGVLERVEGIGTFIFDDDLFTQDVDHAIAVCEAYERAGIGVPFVVNSHVKRLDPRVAAALARAGCKILKLGIEAGSERVRKEVLRRYMTDADIVETVASAEEHRLHSSAFVMVGLPSETHAERWETVDLLARSRPGRFRTSYFFPFPGTVGYDLAIEGGHVRPEDVTSLRTFFDGSCLDFGAEENLFVAKLGKLMPWFVNARLDRHHDSPASETYGPWVERVLAMDAGEWAAFAPRIEEVDGQLSEAAGAAGALHYSIRYNAFMGVRSDWVTAEESGLEWATAAAPPTAADHRAARTRRAAAVEVAR
ncbi:MAG: radical SAM protein [Planctomycetota bacterium]|jgi:radical SAM superfamily enzyme YgiQ (UPF0313 family)|nr:radical SAM protein [Planctomycetota bacterium]MDP6761354.1 radical SAM protein [Planctomycetota bacterium]MDP6989933.1 radical SAM protein [Planctomycetota bacterium]